MKQSTQNFIVTIIKYILFFSVLPFFIIDSVYIVDTVYVTLVIIFLAIVILAFKGEKIFSFKRKEYVISFILTIFFLGMLSLSEIVNSDIFNHSALLERYNNKICNLISAWIRGTYLPCLMISVYVLICSLIQFFTHSRFTEKTYSTIFGWWTKKRCCILISIISLLFLFSTYPGISVTADVAGIWGWVCNKEWTDWHTLGYELFVAFCTSFCKSIFMVNIIQTTLWIISNYYILDILEKFSIKSMHCYTFILTISVIPFAYLQIAYKDVVFSIGMLALTAGIWNITNNQEIQRKDFFMTAFLALFVTLCRHAGWIAPIFGFSALLIYFVIKKKRKEMIKITGIVCCHIGAYMGVYLILFNILNASKIPTYISYGTPMSMIGAAVQEGVAFDTEDTELLERVMPLSEWGICYNKYWADDISRSWGKIGEKINTVEALIQNENYGKDLIKINAKLFLNHPIIYSRALFDMNSIMWEIGRPADEEAMTPVTTIAKAERNEQISYLTTFKITDIVTNFYDDIPILHAFFLRGGISAFILLFSCFIFLLHNKRRYLLALIPLAIYSCALAIVIPAQDTRYILPMMECAIFMMAVIYGLKNQNNSLKTEDLTSSQEVNLKH